jgi:hypothetical protein
LTAAEGRRRVLGRDGDLRARFEYVADELRRNDWPVEPLPDDAPDSVIHARLLVEEKRLRVLGETP